MSSVLPSVQCHIQMYHSQTLQHVKDGIEQDMSNMNGNDRVLICTCAAGMGVNFVGISNVIHHGPPNDIDDFVQQMGRAGRDGCQPVLLFVKFSIFYL
jgi:ATP-dependent DNA helicase RecQ